MRRPLLLVTLLAATTAHADKAKPTVSFETPTVTGALDAKSVSSTMKRNASKFLTCYKRELAASPDIGGLSIVVFSIEADGKVGAATIVERNTSFEKCLIAAVSKLKFVKPKDGQSVSVTYGFTFKPDSKVTAGRMFGAAFPSITGATGSDDVRSHDLEGGDVGYGKGRGPTGIGTGGGGSDGVGLGKSNGPVVAQGTVTTEGDLDKAIIRRYVKRNIAKVRYCYEKELVSNPTLGGKLVADFVIGPDGIVSSSTATGLHANVDACVASVFKSIEFPKPRSSKSVSVKYPLTFRPVD
jgi:hypothetical protein